jgi:predicted RNase H-like nuclease (RuvC/YqgF family)
MMKDLDETIRKLKVTQHKLDQANGYIETMNYKVRKYVMIVKNLQDIVMEQIMNHEDLDAMARIVDLLQTQIEDLKRRVAELEKKKR